nr:hypothetical protein [Bacteroidales bacterium]
MNKYVGENAFRKINFELYNEVLLYNSKFGNISWSQKLYNFNNKIIEIPKCLNCEKFVKFHKYGRGYPQFCSNTCHLKSKETKNKRSQTKLSNHGDANYNNRDKFKKTCLNRFGETSPMKNDDVINKSIQT